MKLLKQALLLSLLAGQFVFMSSQGFAAEVDVLLANAASTNGTTSRDALRTLSSHNYSSNPAIINALIDISRNHADSYSREDAADILVGHTNPLGLQAVIDTLSSPQYANAHSEASYVLRYSKSVLVKPVLLASLSNSSGHVRRNSVLGLGHFTTDPAVVTALTEIATNDRDAVLRESAGESILHLPQAQAVTILSQILGNSSSNGRAEAARNLGNIKSTAIIAPLIAAIDDSNIHVRRQVINALNNHMNDAQAFTVLYNRYAIENDSYNRSMIFEILVKSNDSRALSLARQELISNNKFIIRKSIDYLGLHGDKNDLVNLVAILSSPSESNRAGALAAIKSILRRLGANDPLTHKIGTCLPRATNHDFSQGTKSTAFLMDMFLGGIYSHSASGTYKKVDQLSAENVTALQSVIRELIRDESSEE